MIDRESAIWTEALKLASQHRYHFKFLGNGIYSTCTCGGAEIKIVLADMVPVYKAWEEHVATLQRPQPKPEPIKYAVKRSDRWWSVCSLSGPDAGLSIASYRIDILPNAAARARKLCAELNQETA